MTQLQDRLSSAQSEAVRTRETEDILHRTLLLAQRAADEAVAEATAKSRQMLDEAEMSSRRLVADAEAEARRKGETERRRLEQEIVELAGRRDALLADVEALTRFEAEYRERMVRALESDLSALRTRPTTAPGAKPETSDVEIPDASTDAAAPTTARAGRRRVGPRRGPIRTPTRVEPDADRTATATRPNAEPMPRAEPLAERRVPPRPTRRAGRRGDERGRRAHVVRAVARARSTPTPGARAVAGGRRRGAAERRARAPRACSRSTSPRPTGVDADILDDDAFFATLRDAVHDEAPLGPRDEGDDITGENRFFDQDADRGTFRDVFRRRR